MPDSITLRSPVRRATPAIEPAEAATPWLAIVAEKVKAMRYGVVQVVVHDAKVVQIERTERTRFDVPGDGR